MDMGFSLVHMDETKIFGLGRRELSMPHREHSGKSVTPNVYKSTTLVYRLILYAMLIPSRSTKMSECHTATIVESPSNRTYKKVRPSFIHENYAFTMSAQSRSLNVHTTHATFETHLDARVTLSGCRTSRLSMTYPMILTRC